MKYQPTIYVTVDMLLFKKREEDSEILLIQRLKEPFKDGWALPGGFVDRGEDLLAAALRELKEETSVELANLTQLKAYGNPNRDPRHHTVTIAFWTIVPQDTVVKAQDDAKDYRWFSIKNLPELAFDHAQIIQDGIRALQK